jgi:DNA-binding transcriptional regulator/RsmH inhibitor MraZ
VADSDVLRSPQYDEGYEHLGMREERNLDDKGRVILPAGDWREAFAGGARLTPYRGSLALWTIRSYGSYVARLDAAQREKRVRTGTLDVFRAETRHVTLDNQGRLTLPPDLRDLVGIGGHGSTVVIEGQGDHLEFKPGGRPPRMSAADLVAELDHLDI